MAKCRIAPLNKISTPQMGMNAAVLSKRGRKIIESEMRFEYERVLQLVDSETVLSMINKTSTRFRVTRELESVKFKRLQTVTFPVGHGSRVLKIYRIGLHEMVNQIS
jgi:hypothetical protein